MPSWRPILHGAELQTGNSAVRLPGSPNVASLSPVLFRAADGRAHHGVPRVRIRPISSSRRFSEPRRSIPSETSHSWSSVALTDTRSVKAAAARKLKSTGPVHLVVVEMEPVRFSWMEQHFRSNGLEPPDHELLNAAVSDHTGEASYPSGPEGQEDYGLSLCRGFWRSKLHSPDEPGKSGSEVRVRCVRLSDLLHRWPRVDLVHLDVQGEEWALLREARALLRERVSRLIVGTHSLRLHLASRSLLKRDGWLVQADYFPHGMRRTSLGHIYFHDGLLIARSRSIC